MATLALIRRAVVDEHKWITPEEFTRYWALVLMAPGINLLGLTILIGKKLGGSKGISVALIGLMLPSVVMTIALTALYARAQHFQLMRSALTGIIPATVGVGIFTGGQIALPVLQKSVTLGKRSVLIALLILVGSGAAEAIAHFPVAGILLCSASIGAVAQFAGAPERNTSS